MRAVLATTNPGKAKEATEILTGTSLEVVTVPMWIGDIETGMTYLENARLKASNVLRLTHEAVLAEDAGLEVDALNGLPGLHSARFAGPGATAADNNAKLLALLEGVPAEKRTARYRAVALLLTPSSQVVVGEGVLEGRLAEAPKGEGGFGYDPLFIPEGFAQTAAELTPDEKNAISHRGRAFRALLENAKTAGLLG
jgi:XTP/dITP diphosphohydrolase